LITPIGLNMQRASLISKPFAVIIAGERFNGSKTA
jgi:hypothetical protein